MSELLYQAAIDEQSSEPPRIGRKGRIRNSLAAAGLLLLSPACASDNRAEIGSVQVVAEPLNFDAMEFDYDPDIISYPEPLPNPLGDKKIAPTGITLHWWGFEAGGNIDGLVDGLRTNTACGSTGCSVQYGITGEGKGEGSIYRMMKSGLEIAFHARGANYSTIGIEIEGGPEHFSLIQPFFDQDKFEAVVSLTAEIVDDFNMPVEGAIDCSSEELKVFGVHGHHEYEPCLANPSGKTDVGAAYTQAVIDAVYYMQENEQK